MFSRVSCIFFYIDIKTLKGLGSFGGFWNRNSFKVNNKRRKQRRISSASVVQFL